MSSSGIKQLLENKGHRFNFFQAVRLLEASMKDRPEVGGLGPYGREVVRILPSNSLSFAPSDVQRIERRPDDGNSPPWILYEHFLGLYGPNTASPIFIAEMIAQCIDDEDPLKDFLDIFNHRILSLYYRAWKKHNFAASVVCERKDAVSRILSALMGRDGSETAESERCDHRKYLYYSSLFSSSNRSAPGLEAILSDYFQVETVHVIQYVPRNIKLTSTTHNLVSNSDTGGCLGLSFVLGEIIRDIAGQFKVRFEGLSKSRFYEFQPGGNAYGELVHLINLYTQKRLGYSLELVLEKGQADTMRVSANEPVGRLGRSAWIGNPCFAETTVEVNIEA